MAENNDPAPSKPQPPSSFLLCAFLKQHAIYREGRSLRNERLLTGAGQP